MYLAVMQNYFQSLDINDDRTKRSKLIFNVHKRYGDARVVFELYLDERYDGITYEEMCHELRAYYASGTNKSFFDAVNDIMRVVNDVIPENTKIGSNVAKVEALTNKLVSTFMNRPAFDNQWALRDLRDSFHEFAASRILAMFLNKRACELTVERQRNTESMKALYLKVVNHAMSTDKSVYAAKRQDSCWVTPHNTNSAIVEPDSDVALVNDATEYYGQDETEDQVMFATHRMGRGQFQARGRQPMRVAPRGNPGFSRGSPGPSGYSQGFTRGSPRPPVPRPIPHPPPHPSPVIRPPTPTRGRGRGFSPRKRGAPSSLKDKSTDFNLFCYHCGGMGHIVRDCRWYSGSQYTLQNQYNNCFRCGGRGHMSRECPNPPLTSTYCVDDEDDTSESVE
jgi:hypothetical protein